MNNGWKLSTVFFSLSCALSNFGEGKMFMGGMCLICTGIAFAALWVQE